MVTIRILNISFHGLPDAPNRVYVGCYTPSFPNLRVSPLGNRARHRPLSEALAVYRDVLEAIVADDHPGSQAMKELRRLCALHEEHGELCLLCWCAPEAGWTTADKPYGCHAQIIAEIIEKMLE